MHEITRTYSEIVSMAKLEPGLKNVYVEGLSDKYFLNNFLKHHNVQGIVIYEIDSVDFSELYKGMSEEDVTRFVNSNKERVILLAKSLEQELNNMQLPTICVVDIDFDIVLNNFRTGRYLSYTDYNSMDMYLYAKDVIESYLKEGHRISKLKVDNLMSSLANICRIMFHVHCIMHENKKKIVENTKDLSFDKTMQSCTLDFEKYWRKSLSKSGLTSHSEELSDIFKRRKANQCDERMEIRGHDFVSILYYCAKQIKSKIKMDDEEFANMFWKYANFDSLAQEPLFQKLMNL